MNIIPHLQGSPEWAAARAEHFTASEAPAMMGVSKHMARGELLRQKATGVAPEIDARTQALFDRGHAAEAAARPIAEQLTGELYPVTCSVEVEGLKLLASLDGATMMEDTIWECKLWRSALAADIRTGDIAPHYTVQMDQQLLVSGARRCLFMTSDGAPENTAWRWYETTPEKRAALIAGWKQFAADLAAYAPPAAAESAPVGRAPDTLPALRIEVTGQVTASNLAEFKSTALAAIRSVNRDLKTDADFADAEKAVKWCGDVEERLAAAKQHALSQTASIDALFKAIDDISAEARRVRLDLDKVVKARKEAIRGEIVAGAVAAFAEHVRGLNDSLNAPYMPRIAADFVGVIKSKRTVASLQDAVDTELARVKIEANAAHQRISQNMRTLGEQNNHRFLFADEASLVLKAPDDLAAAISTRIAEHAAKEAKRLEAERERIRAEEQAKAQREAQAESERTERIRDFLQGIREGADDARMSKTARDVLREIEHQTQVKTPTRERFQEFYDEAVSLFESTLTAMRQIHAQRVSEEAAARAAEVRPELFAAAPVASRPAAAASAAEPATLKLGAICERLGFTLTAAFVAETLGIAHSATDKAAKLYRPSDFERICDALTRHVAAVREMQEA